MRVLYITPSIPNEFSRIRTINLLKSFKENGCEVDIISLYTDKRELKYLTTLDYNIKIVKQPKLLSYINCIIGLFLPIPLQNAYVYSIKMHYILSKLKKDYDLIYIKRLRMAGYARYFDKRKVYIDLTDSLTKYYERVKNKSKGISKIINIEEYIKHLRYEIKIARIYNTIVCSDDEKEYLESKHNIKLDNMKVICNSIDVTRWYCKNIKINKKRTRLVFSGVMDYLPNVLATKFIINEIMPILSDNYSVTFIGKNVSEELKKYESERIKFTGYVKDVKKELEKYDIYLCPIVAGSGVKNKILQASLVGLPIITTNLGVEGIKEGFKKFVFIANTGEDFALQIKKVNSMDVTSLTRLVEGQQEFIKKNYDYKTCIKGLIG